MAAQATFIKMLVQLPQSQIMIRATDVKEKGGYGNGNQTNSQHRESVIREETDAEDFHTR